MCRLRGGVDDLRAQAVGAKQGGGRLDDDGVAVEQQHAISRAGGFDLEELIENFLLLAPELRQRLQRAQEQHHHLANALEHIARLTYPRTDGTSKHFRGPRFLHE